MLNIIFTPRMSEAFAHRQQDHAQAFQRQLQALYTQMPGGPPQPVPFTTAERLAQTVGDLEQIRAMLPDPVSQGKVLAALHILHAVLEVP